MTLNEEEAIGRCGRGAFWHVAQAAGSTQSWQGVGLTPSSTTQDIERPGQAGEFSLKILQLPHFDASLGIAYLKKQSLGALTLTSVPFRPGVRKRTPPSAQ